MRKRIVIFGVGKIYENNKYRISENIVCLIDNSKTKQGCIVDGLEVLPPESLQDIEFDYVLITISSFETIITQLLDLGIDRNKICTFKDIINRFSYYEKVCIDNGECVSIDSWISQRNAKAGNKTKCIGIVFTDMSRTGIQTALLNLAILLKKMSYDVLCISPDKGKFTFDIEEAGLPCLYSRILYEKDASTPYELKKIDAFFVGSIIMSEIVCKLDSFNKPILWWLHESGGEYIQGRVIPQNNNGNIKYLSGGSRVNAAMEKYLNITDMIKLYYSLADNGEGNRKERYNRNNLRFCTIGIISKRKAQDILFMSVNILDKEYSENGVLDPNFELIVIGYQDDKTIIEYAKDIKHFINFIEELPYNELEKYYEQIDVLICPSRDDPMPIVVTKAMQRGIPCIVSTEVGQAEFIENGINGFVFESENSVALAETMEKILLMDRNELREIGAKGKEVFEKYFSEDVMKNKLQKILQDVGV